MSKRCQITGARFGTGNNMVVNRRKVSRRTKRRFNLNLINKKFVTKHLGNRVFTISTGTYRTICKKKYGDLETFLVKTKRANLSPEALKLRKKIYNKLCS